MIISNFYYFMNVFFQNIFFIIYCFFSIYKLSKQTYLSLIGLALSLATPPLRPRSGQPPIWYFLPAIWPWLTLMKETETMTKFLKAANDNGAHILNRIINWIEFSGTCRALNSLPEDVLKDIGVERAQIPQFVWAKLAADIANTNHAAWFPPSSDKGEADVTSGLAQQWAGPFSLKTALYGRNWLSCYRKMPVRASDPMAQRSGS